MRGAGGTSGGTGSFIVGLLMFGAGIYLLLHNITVSHAFSFATPLYRVPMGTTGWAIPSGSLLIPLLAGIGLIFYNAKSIWGWLVAGGALAALIFGVLMSLTISLRTMSLLDLLIILVLCAGGLGLFLRSLRAS